MFTYKNLQDSFLCHKAEQKLWSFKFSEEDNKEEDKASIRGWQFDVSAPACQASLDTPMVLLRLETQAVLSILKKTSREYTVLKSKTNLGSGGTVISPFSR